MSDYYHYWGKTAENKNYHLLPYHCIDVAAVGWYLFSPNTPLCRRLAERLDVKRDWLQAWLAFCFSLHDIGKFATAFQGLVPQMAPELVQSNPRMLYTERHDTLGFMLWREVLSDRWLRQGGLGFNSDDPTLKKYLRAFDPWLEIVTGHHGAPPKISSCRHQNFFTLEDEEAAFEYILAMAELFLSDIDLAVLADKSFKKRLKQQSWLIAGAVVLSDWLGSSLETSDYCKTLKELKTYFNDRALPMAHRILSEADLSPACVSPFLGLKNLFPFIHEPTPLQHWTASTTIFQEPQLFILEDVTGAGKTEAALTLVHRIMADGLADGLYVALPTMATANAMYERLAKAYRRLFTDGENPSIVLAHGARHLSDGFRASVGPSEVTGKKCKYTKDEDSGEAYCSAWLADSRKKSLLADVGVGTIDQALLAVLPAKHQSLRLMGLARKVLIVDEVHAYDPYMNQLLQTLLEAHARNGGSAVLLSATLPQEMRERYVKAFCDGSGQDIPELSLTPDYPLATRIPPFHGYEWHVQTRRETERKVSIVTVSDIEQVETIVRMALEKKQCVCWIRNTVGDARNAYDHFSRQEWVDNANLSLFHSRFAMIDRQRIETETLHFFGKDSNAENRSCRLVMATQVVEQSLDLDFDVLISDLAPMDLLIQRAGRLHRHIRDKNGVPLIEKGATDQRGEAVLYVLGPEPTDTPQADWLKAEFAGTQVIYPHVGQLWLTQKRLVEAGAIETPKASRQLIEGVYGIDVQDEIPEALQEISFDAEGTDSSKRGMARLNALNLSRGYTRSSSEDINGWDEETRIPTRLSDETITVALARIEQNVLKPYAQGTEFDWEMSMFNLPYRDWEIAMQKIPDQWTAPINQLKETERVLKWVEVLPLTAEVQACYDSLMGWSLNKEKANESD